MRDTVALYIRLSLEDGDLCSGSKAESESVTNQRNLLYEYLRTSPQLGGFRTLEFCDDGYSGKNFDRPGFKQMIAAARAGEIQCIVVKDLSRFGRDYLTVGNYISRVFPFLGVRLIAVNDHFDSSRKGDIDSLDTSFKTLIYDMYSRDLSQKVKSAKQQLVQRGIYINPVAPFGYRKAPDDRHVLVADPVAAETVRHIFAWAAAGHTTREIATQLNAEKAPTPSAQKRGTSGEHANWRTDIFWTQRMVWEIIRERQYAGSLVWGKRVRHQIGTHHQFTTDVEDRVILDGHHEPLVTMELYEAAQAALGGPYHRNPKNDKQDYPLRGKVYCGACGRKMYRRAQKASYFLCDTPKTLPESECCRNKVFECELTDIVTELIRKQAQCVVDARRLAALQNERVAAQKQRAETELQKLEAQYTQLAKQEPLLYEKLVNGTLSKERYLSEKAAVQTRRGEASAQMEQARLEIQALKSAQDHTVDGIGKHVGLDTLTYEVSAELVERVTICSNGEIDVRLNYADEVAALMELKRFEQTEGA